MIMKMIINNHIENIIYSLHKSLINYLIINDIFKNDFQNVDVEKDEYLCSLDDDKNIFKYENDYNFIYEIFLYEHNRLRSTKIGKYVKMIEFLTHVDNVFELEINTIRIKKMIDIELL